MSNRSANKIPIRNKSSSSSAITEIRRKSVVENGNKGKVEKKQVEEEESDGDTTETEKGEGDEDSDEENTIFDDVIEALDLDKLKDLATKFRVRREAKADPKSKAKALPCSIETASLGSYNVVYVLRFADGVRWVARIPGNGSSSFTELDKKRMVSDVYSMKLIRSTTSIPVPEVYAWETTSDSIGAPFVFMSWVKGRKVSDCWFDKKWATEERRQRTLVSIANAMSQFHKLRFDKIGALNFDSTGKVVDVGELVQREDELPEEEDDGGNPFGTPEPCGPFQNVPSFLMNEAPDEDDEEGDLNQGVVKLLELAMRSMPQTVVKAHDFYLSHPDLGIQNILVDDNGDLTGIIDWDCTQTQPRIGGFAGYPPWIIKDWNPAADVNGAEGNECAKDLSPEKLLRYRRLYADQFAKLKLPAKHYAPDDTKLSHLYAAIYNAAKTAAVRPLIVQKLLNHAFSDKPPFDLRKFGHEYAAGNADEWIAKAQGAFKKMWREEW